jgi:hypothetical protein
MARFTLSGRIAVRLLATLPADEEAPTVAELNAGINLVGTAQAEELMEFEGFLLEAATIPTPGYASNRVGNVAGDNTYPDSRMSFYKDDTSETIWTALADGETGWVALAWDGVVASRDVTLFPARVISRVRRPARDAAHIFDVNFAIDVPFEGTIAA